MRRVFVSIERLAESTASIIITGESGTGKEFAARAIHQLSTRKSTPFVGINCAAIPPTMMESERLGHERDETDRMRGVRSARAFARREQIEREALAFSRRNLPHRHQPRVALLSCLHRRTGPVRSRPGLSYDE